MGMGERLRRFGMADNIIKPGTRYLLIGILMLTIITGFWHGCGKKNSASGGSSGSAITNPATQVTATSAVLNGTVNPNGLTTNAYFQWGLTTSYGITTTAQAIGNGSVSLPVSATLSGLTPTTLYNFRIVSTDAEGTTYGGNLTFTTLVTPPAQVSSPTPGNGAINVPITQQLSWGAVLNATYNVYFGTTTVGWTPVVTNTVLTFFSPSVLSFNTQYYWRIDSTNAVSGTTTGNVWSFTTIDVPPAQAGLAGLVDGATNVSVNQPLSWGAASGATSYNVYFGTTDTNLTFITNTVLTSFTPSVLSFNTQYYWRIDSVNAAGTTTGNIWSFTTEPPPPPPPQASSPIPTNTATAVLINQQLSWGAASGAVSYNVYFGTTSTSLTFITNTVFTFFSPFVLSLSTIYYWRIDSVNAGGTTTGIVWSFTTTSIAPPAQVISPTPFNGAIGVSLNQQLSWGAVPGATYNVYFGTTTINLTFITNTVLTSFSSSVLSFNTQYYWRIDSTSAISGTTTGIVWSFTTIVNLLAVDDYCWVADSNNGSVTRILKSTPIINATAITESGNLYGVAVDETYCWVSNYYQNYVVRINKMNFSTTLIAAETYSAGIAVDSDYCWLANNRYGGGNTVTRIRKADFSTTIITVGSCPLGVAVDADYCWVTNYGGDSGSDSGTGTTVTRIKKSDSSTTTITVGTGPRGVAVDGTFCWVANRGSNNITRITKAGLGMTTIALAAGDQPYGVAVDGTYCWVGVNSTGTDYVTRILKSDITQRTTIYFGGGNPNGVAVDADYCWLAVGNKVVRIVKSSSATTTIAMGSFAYCYSLGDMTGYAFDYYSRVP
jgi:hypothetical protein